jgi:hypothetical protein
MQNTAWSSNVLYIFFGMHRVDRSRLAFTYSEHGMVQKSSMYLISGVARRQITHQMFGARMEVHRRPDTQCMAWARYLVCFYLWNGRRQIDYQICRARHDWASTLAYWLPYMQSTAWARNLVSFYLWNGRRQIDYQICRARHDMGQ